MAIVNEPFSVRRGDDRLIEVDVSDDKGAPVEVANLKIRLTYGKGADRRPTKVITEADVTVAGKVIRYRMRPAETLSLEAYATYWIQCRIIFPDGTEVGFQETVATGSFTVEQMQG